MDERSHEQGRQAQSVKDITTTETLRDFTTDGIQHTENCSVSPQINGKDHVMHHSLDQCQSHSVGETVGQLPSTLEVAQ